MVDRRRTRRRRLPYVRSGVLEVGTRSHIVTVADLSPEGAFLATPMRVDAGLALALRMVLPRESRQVRLPCTLVRQTDHLDLASGQPAGLAVRFTDLDSTAVRRVESAAAASLPDASRAAERFEYRVLNRTEVNETELGRLGADGWRLAAALPAPEGVQLVLLRRM